MCNFVSISIAYLTHFAASALPFDNQSTDLIVVYLRTCGAVVVCVCVSVRLCVHRVCSENVTTAWGQQQSTKRRWRLLRDSHQFGMATVKHTQWLLTHTHTHTQPICMIVYRGKTAADSRWSGTMSVLPLLKLNHFPISVSGTVSMVRVSDGSTARRIRAHGIAYILHTRILYTTYIYYLLKGEVGIGANAIAARLFLALLLFLFSFQFSASFCFACVLQIKRFLIRCTSALKRECGHWHKGKQ